MSEVIERSTQVLPTLEKCVVWHPGFTHAYELVHKSIRTTETRQAASSMMLIGPTGTGKSKLCERIAQEFGCAEKLGDNNSQILTKGCLLVEVPPDATIKTLAIQMLSRMVVENRERLEKSSGTALTRMIIQRLIVMQTQLIILDEFHRLLDQGQGPTKKKVCRWINQILNETKIPVLLVGLPTVEKLIDEISELSDRYPYRARLRYFDIGNDAAKAQFRKLIEAIENKVIDPAGFSERIALSQAMPFNAICLATAGNLRHLNMLLNDALTIALEREDNKFTLEDFAQAADDLDFCRASNPFRLSGEALSAQMRKEYAKPMLSPVTSGVRK
ncbi:ATP-binding protein [Pseudomonas japonica]|uniref:TniB protein n=1 Tax=Pseudomonas japonica TaxID=256466 RepID=A0A239I530_9PSED|nr:ATP-binding protein [Pseudomonas japonica]SNS88398.1 TniB protein [Pseudomonas japonica]